MTEVNTRWQCSPCKHPAQRLQLGMTTVETASFLQFSLNQLPGLSSIQSTFAGPQTCDQGLGAFADLFCSFLWGAGLCPSFPTLAPTQDWGWPPELWPKVKVFHKA